LNIWGILPLANRWSENEHALETSYLWSAGMSVDSPLSNSMQLSFAYAYAAARNPLTLLVSDLLSESVQLFSHFDEFNRMPHEVLAAADYLELVRRWNMLLWKLTDSLTLMRSNRLADAEMMFSSAKLDSERIHLLLHTGAANVDTSLRCNVYNNADRRFSWTPAAVLLTILVGGAIGTYHAHSIGLL